MSSTLFGRLNDKNVYKTFVSYSPLIHISFCYIATRVLLENTPLVKFIRKYIRDPSGVFSISSLVRMLVTSFPTFSRLFVQTVSEIMASDIFVCIIKENYTMA